MKFYWHYSQATQIILQFDKFSLKKCYKKIRESLFTFCFVVQISLQFEDFFSKKITLFLRIWDTIQNLSNCFNIIIYLPVWSGSDFSTMPSSSVLMNTQSWKDLQLESFGIWDYSCTELHSLIQRTHRSTIELIPLVLSILSLWHTYLLHSCKINHFVH